MTQHHAHVDSLLLLIAELTFVTPLILFVDHTAQHTTDQLTRFIVTLLTLKSFANLKSCKKFDHS